MSQPISIGLPAPRDGVGAYRAPNRANDLSLSLAADGFHAARYREGELLWDFGLSLAAYGEQAFPAAIAEGGLVGSRERVEYHWSRDVVEWYTNSTHHAQCPQFNTALGVSPIKKGAQ